MSKTLNTPLGRRLLLSSVAGLGAVALADTAARSAARPAASTDGLVLPPATEAVAPFRVAVPPTAIADLKARLRGTRWPERETVGDWSQGVPLAHAREIASYWADRYDWRAFESRINAFPQFRTKIDDLGIHFLHVRSRHPDALPIIMTHGWPGSVIEFLHTIRPLTDPTAFGGRAEDAFHVVVPSLPGHGFSDKPSEPGWNRMRVARAWAVLMKRLGYDRWVAQGGDWGAGVTLTLAQQKPGGLVAAHVNWPLVIPTTPPAQPTAREATVFAHLKYFGDEGLGYFKEQGSKPQTIGYSLVGSPVGLATWLYEKFHDWSDHSSTPEAFSMTEMLDDISLYWFTATGASAARFYWENQHSQPPFSFDAGPVDLPMAATVYTNEAFPMPKAWAEKRWSHLFYWNEINHGGHFAAWEQPALFVADIRKAFSSIRRS